MIRKLLVANRGEIACRIMRTSHQMGIATVAVFAGVDERAPHVREAGEAVRLTGETPVAAYLNIAALLDAARRTGADAVHPGYGFLAENATFAAACRDAGLIFVGPTPEVIARMGSKREARLLVASAGVPVVPGYDGDDQSNGRLITEAARIGYPVMVKASAGGGGKGMRIVARAEDAPEAIDSARREALAAFGDSSLILERAVEHARHIEFQIFGDPHGALVHLGERECSIQRHHQKVIEESPAPGLTPALRKRMAAAALTVGRLLNYTNAGTVEFLLDPDGTFYFLEVNTRLQVEHPVTELVTGLDLVRWQIEVAEGKPLPLAQSAIVSAGHAIEARLCAEEPANGFLPATGRLVMWRAPDDLARVDAGVQADNEISPHFDSLIAKISAHAQTRAEAARSLASAMERTVTLGVRTNSAFLARTLRHPAFLEGATTTDFIQRYQSDLFAEDDAQPGAPASPEMAALFAALACMRDGGGPLQTRWRNNPNRPRVERFTLRHHGVSASPKSDTFTASLATTGQARFAASIDSTRGTWRGDIRLREYVSGRLSAEVDGHVLGAWVASDEDGTWWVALAGRTWELALIAPLSERGAAGVASGSLIAPMPGVVVAIRVEVGQRVRAGDSLMTLEAMKMEHTVRAPHSGVVVATCFAAGDRVPAGAVLLDIEREPDNDE